MLSRPKPVYNSQPRPVLYLVSGALWLISAGLPGISACQPRTWTEQRRNFVVNVKHISVNYERVISTKKLTAVYSKHIQRVPGTVVQAFAKDGIENLQLKRVLFPFSLFHFRFSQLLDSEKSRFSALLRKLEPDPYSTDASSLSEPTLFSGVGSGHFLV